MNAGSSLEQELAGIMTEVRATGLLSSLCTILVPPGVFDAGGAPDPSVPYTPLAGHVDIPCTAPPISTGDGVVPTEVKSMAEILSRNILHVLLDGYYPTIISDYKAAIRRKGAAASTAVQYDILNSESDSQAQMTRMAAQLATI